MAKQEFLETKIEANSYEEKAWNFEKQQEDLNNQIIKLDFRSSNVQNSLSALEGSQKNLFDQIECLTEENRQIAVSLKDKEEILGLRKDELADLERSMATREKEAKALEAKIIKGEKEMAQMEVKLEKFLEEEAEISKNTFEKFQVDLRKLAPPYLGLSPNDLPELKDIGPIYFLEGENGPVEIKRESYEFSKRYPQELKEIEAKLAAQKREFASFGDINWQAVGDFEKQKGRFEFLKKQEGELAKSMEDLQKAVSHIDLKAHERFELAFLEVQEKFRKIFPIVFGGGTADLKLLGSFEDPECGVDIFAQPLGKKTQNISLMSGGEKALTAVSLLFAIFLIKPSPFVLLDEVDAPLDEANVGRFNELLKELAGHSQFILITHNKKTMSLNETLYGITMQEPGVSKCVSVQFH
jgi:chromosome segregation protein